LILALIGFIALFLAGARFLEPRQAELVFAIATCVTGLVAAVVGQLGTTWSPVQRWLLSLSAASLAPALGLLARMTLHELLK
jgi:hypothetical protein